MEIEKVKEGSGDTDRSSVAGRHNSACVTPQNSAFVSQALTDGLIQTNDSLSVCRSVCVCMGVELVGVKPLGRYDIRYE